MMSSHEKDVGMDLRSDTKLAAGRKSFSSMHPAERPWENDIVTYDSEDDPQNPKNWSYGRKAFVTMLFGLTTSCAYLFIARPSTDILFSVLYIRIFCLWSCLAVCFGGISRLNRGRSSGTLTLCIGVRPWSNSCVFGYANNACFDSPLLRIASFRAFVRNVWKTNIGTHTDVYIHLLVGGDGNSDELADHHDYEVLRRRNG